MGGLSALDAFYLNYNDVNFFVEDVDQENLYFEIFRKLFPDVSYDKVFGLGGKQEVLAHAQNPENESLKKRVYVLDKDFDDLLGTKVEIPNVHYLDAFCIENHLIEVDALVEIAVESRPRVSKDEIRAMLALEDVLAEMEMQLRTLFAFFLLVQLEDLGLPNCKSKPERFCDPKKLWIVLNESIAAYHDAVNQALDDKELKEVTNAEEDERLGQFFEHPPHSIINGKFWLNMIFHYIKWMYPQGSMTFDSFVYRLAKNCVLESMLPLRERISDQIAV